MASIVYKYGFHQAGYKLDYSIGTKHMLIDNSKQLFVYGYLQITNRCVHTVSTQQLTDYRESLKPFIPRSYQVAIS